MGYKQRAGKKKRRKWVITMAPWVNRWTHAKPPGPICPWTSAYPPFTLYILYLRAELICIFNWVGPLTWPPSFPVIFCVPVYSVLSNPPLSIHHSSYYPAYPVLLYSLHCLHCPYHVYTPVLVFNILFIIWCIFRTSFFFDYFSFFLSNFLVLFLFSKPSNIYSYSNVFWCERSACARTLCVQGQT